MPLNTAADDLSALAWVHAELRRSLEAANKALRRFLKESQSLDGSDVDTVDPSILRGARAQLHQGAGALELVGLPAAAQVLRAAEAAVQRMIARPATVDVRAVETVERCSFAVLDFIGRRVGGKPVSPVAMFPQYRDAQQLAGAERVHPADLWGVDWSWRELPADAGAAPRAADEAARGEMEALVLALMRQPAPAVQRAAGDLCSGLAAGAADAESATVWRLAAAFFEAQASGRLQAGDVYGKRVASRLLSHLRASLRGEAPAADRLALELLFFCLRAGTPDDTTPRLAAVRAAWPDTQGADSDYETASLGRFDPALIAQARKRLASAKELWSDLSGGELHRMPGLVEQFSLVEDSVRKLVPGGDRLAQALHEAARQTQMAGDAPAPALAMEVATAMLYLDAAIEDGDLDQPETAGRIDRLAGRIDGVRQGGAPGPLEPWMEELYRRVSDRQTMGSVVHELRVSLSEVEKQLDPYFRDPTQRQLLLPVPGQLSAMRGVLSVLGVDAAAQAVAHMRDDVDGLAQAEAPPPGAFARLADNLGALGFLVDMLGVQPQVAMSLFRFDPASGRLGTVMGQGAVHAEPVPASAQPALEPSAPTQPAAALAPAEVPSIPAPAPAPSTPPVTGLEDDDEMREIFVEEAREVIAGAREALDRLAVSPADLGEITTVRRAFHTLKGSGRMVGLRDFGEAAWACEQLFNARLAQAAPMDDDWRGLSLEVLDYLGDWTEAIAAGRDDGHGFAGVARAADALRLDGRRLPIDAGAPSPGEPATTATSPFALEMPLLSEVVEAAPAVAGEAAPRAFGDAPELPPLPELPEATDPSAITGFGDLSEAPAMPTEAPAAEAAEAAGLSFELDLGDLGGPSPAAEDATAPSVEALPAMPLASLPELDFGDLLGPAEAASRPPATDEAPAAGEAAEVAEAVEWDGWPSDQDLPPATEGEAGEAAPAVPEPVLEFEPEPGLQPETAPVVEPTVSAEPEPAFELAAPVEVDRAEPAGADLEPAPEASVGVEALEIDLGDLGDAFDLPLADDVTAPGAVSASEPELSLTTEAEPEATLVCDVAPATAALPDLALPLDDEAASPPLPEPADAAELAASAPAEPRELSLLAVVPEPGEPAAHDVPPATPEDEFKQVGPLRIALPLFNIYIHEADDLSRRLLAELTDWVPEAALRPVDESTVALAHSLAGSSATVGYADLSSLARALEHALERSQRRGAGRPGEAELFAEIADEIRRLLHQFAAGFLHPVAPLLLERLAEHERGLDDPTAAPVPGDASLPQAEPAPDVAREAGAVPQTEPEPAPEFAVAEAQAALADAPATDEAATEPVPATPVEAMPRLETTTYAPLSEAVPELAPATLADAEAFDDDDDIEAQDALDDELFPIFEEEGGELLPQLQSRLREWAERPDELAAASACMRALHTFKGGARLAGAMRLGEMAHRLETAIEHRVARAPVPAVEIEPLLARVDAMSAAFEALRAGGVPSAEVPAAEAMPAAAPEAPAAPSPEVADATAPAAGQPVIAPESGSAPEAASALPVIDWQRFTTGAAATASPGASERSAISSGAVRVRASLLDRLVNAAGEVSITRSRIDAEMKQLQGALGELTDSLERLRRQLRDIELQAETQMSSRMEAARASAADFDPLEMDRFTRFQELTRFMAESVNDVATLQRGLQRTLQSTEDQLAAQARLTRELQDDLLRTRMVEFESLAERLYRVVRQAGKDAGKPVRLDIAGGAIEVDRGVLERMVAPFEHLLRNCVAHGIESPEQREAAGKDRTGTITVTVTHEGNEVGVEVRDDGAGLDLGRIRQRGIERGLIAADAEPTEAELASLIFRPGFSTAASVSELAGRGVGLDVVLAEVNAMGGRIETASAPGRGTSFRLLLPLTTAVTQVVMLSAGGLSVAVPSTLVEVVRRVPAEEVEAAYASGGFALAGQRLPFFWLPSLLGGAARGPAGSRSATVVVVRSAAQRIALHVDEISGNQEVVVKNVGPQLSRLPALAGVTLLASGAAALIYNPVALAAVYGDEARARLAQARPAEAPLAAPEPEALAPLVLVVDDSLTVRRVTQRLLQREGYRVALAKDGLEALERLAAERPAVMLSDIEMPRMDGFDLLRNVRADERFAGLPVVMITSRIAQKHRDYAAQLGADHYLGKPYAEEELLALVARYAGQAEELVAAA